MGSLFIVMLAPSGKATLLRRFLDRSKSSRRAQRAYVWCVVGAQRSVKDGVQEGLMLNLKKDPW